MMQCGIIASNGLPHAHVRHISGLRYGAPLEISEFLADTAANCTSSRRGLNPTAAIVAVDTSSKRITVSYYRAREIARYS